MSEECQDPLASAASQILPAPRTVAEAPRTEPATIGRGAGLWLPALLLGSVLFSALLVLRRPDGLWAYVVGGMIVLVLGWVVISSLWPGRAERKCPACQREGLVRLNTKSHRGLRCRRCGFEDADASCFFLAEEEGTLEETVLLERGRTHEVEL